MPPATRAESRAISSWRVTDNYVNVAYAPDAQMAETAFATKATVMPKWESRFTFAETHPGHRQTTK